MVRTPFSLFPIFKCMTEFTAFLTLLELCFYFFVCFLIVILLAEFDVLRLPVRDRAACFFLGLAVSHRTPTCRRVLLCGHEWLAFCRLESWLPFHQLCVPVLCSRQLSQCADCCDEAKATRKIGSLYLFSTLSPSESSQQWAWEI